MKKNLDGAESLVWCPTIFPRPLKYLFLDHIPYLFERTQNKKIRSSSNLSLGGQISKPMFPPPMGRLPRHPLRLAGSSPSLVYFLDDVRNSRKVTSNTVLELQNNLLLAQSNELTVLRKRARSRASQRSIVRSPHSAPGVS